MNEWVSWWEKRGAPGFLSDYITQDSLVFDIGANVGKMTWLYLGLGARVIAVEPQSVCVKALEERYGGNDRATIVHGAVGPQKDKALMAIYGTGSTISTLVPDRYWGPDGPWQGTPKDGEEWVDVITMDDLVNEHGLPDYAKVDVEGYEREVLSGLSRHIPLLSFEFHPFWAREACQCMARLLEVEPETVFAQTNKEMLSFEIGWVGYDQMKWQIEQLRKQHGTNYFGNIYCRKAM